MEAGGSSGSHVCSGRHLRDPGRGKSGLHGCSGAVVTEWPHAHFLALSNQPSHLGASPRSCAGKSQKLGAHDGDPLGRTSPKGSSAGFPREAFLQGRCLLQPHLAMKWRPPLCSVSTPAAPLSHVGVPLCLGFSC